MGPHRAVTEGVREQDAPRGQRAPGTPPGQRPPSALRVVDIDAPAAADPGPAASLLEPRHVDDVTSWLRRLQVLAVLLPVVAIASTYLIRPAMQSALGIGRTHLLVGSFLALAVIAFSAVMFAVLTRGYQIIAAQNDELSRRDQRRAVLGERDRLSREMHDHLAQVLATVRLRLHALPDCCDDPEVRTELAEITELCEESYRDVRESILALRVAGADGRDLLTSVRHYARGCARHTGQTVRIEVSADAQPALTADAQIQAMRIIQEALTNVRKHAGTDTATVRIEPGDPVLIEIVDEGRGFDVDAPGDRLHHFGLRTMAERAHLVGGEFTVDSRPGAGTRIQVRLPRADGVTGNEADG